MLRKSERFARYRLERRGYLTDTPDGALIDYVPLNGGQWGNALSSDVLRRFCEALECSPEIVVSLDNPDELLRGIDRAIDDLSASEYFAVVLAGNWSHLRVALRLENLEGYEAPWRLPEDDRVGVIGRYRGCPILSARDNEDRCVYVVDLLGWGHFVRARTDGEHDLRIEIKPISINRAKELLAANPEHFASQPDEESKLRKLQTHVEMVIGARTGFRVADHTRARRIVPFRQADVKDEESQR